MRSQVGFLMAVLLAAPLGAAAQARTFTAGSAERQYLLHVPQGAKPDAPLLIVLHGRGASPDGLFVAWRPLSEKHRFVLVAPKSADVGWRKSRDGVAVFETMLASVRSAIRFDETRIYLFGYSNGAAHALDLAMLWSERVAAVATIAGSLLPSERLEALATRKLPVLLFAAEQDTISPPAEVRQTRQTLHDSGFAVEYRELRGVGHAYGQVADEVHRRAWNFLSRHRLHSQRKK